MNIQACKINCEEKTACADEATGLGADCTGFRGCHNECPEGSMPLTEKGERKLMRKGILYLRLIYTLKFDKLHLD